MNAILKNVLPHPLIEKYLPDRNGKLLRVDQPYFLAIVAKVEPDYLNAMNDAGHTVRYTAPVVQGKVATIKIKKALHTELMKYPYDSGK